MCLKTPGQLKKKTFLSASVSLFSSPATFTFPRPLLSFSLHPPEALGLSPPFHSPDCFTYTPTLTSSSALQIFKPPFSIHCLPVCKHPMWLPCSPKFLIPVIPLPGTCTHLNFKLFLEFGYQPAALDSFVWMAFLVSTLSCLMTPASCMSCV